MAGGIQAGTAYIPVKADMSKFGTEVEQGAKGASGKLKNAAKIVGGAFALNVGKDLLTDALGGARESQALANQTAQVIKTTGSAANVTAEQVGDLSSALSKKTAVDDEIIQSGANMLLTFKNVKNEVGEGNDIFNQTVALGNDMSVALGQDMKSSALQLGKALNDPVKGVSALQRVGVSFTAEQKEQIKTMVEAGDTMGAQKLILGELEDQFGGSAAAQADASKKASVAWGNFQEMIGGLLIPVVDKLLAILTKVTDWATENPGKVKVIGGVIGGALVVAFVAWAIAAAQAAAATIAATWPIIAIIAAVGLLVAGLVWAYNEFDIFRAIVDGVAGFLTGTLIPAVGDVIEWFGSLATKAAEIATSIGQKVGDIIGFFTGLPGKLADAAGDVFGFLWTSFKSVINSVIRAWNGLEFKLPDIKWNPPGPGSINITGPTLGFPDIPTLHDGGIFEAPGGAREGLALLETGERVIPKAMSTRGLGSRSPLEGLKLVVDGREFGRLMRDDDWRYGLENGS